jgi:hypothetical protein
MRNRWKNFVAWFDASVTIPEDSESIRIRKTTITIAYLVLIPITFLWTLALLNLQLWAAGWINLADEIVHLPDFLLDKPYASRNISRIK